MKTNIVYCIGSLDRGGAELHLLNVLPNLNKEKYSLSILLLTSSGVLAEEFQEKGIEIIKPWVSLRSRRLFVRLIRLFFLTIQIILFFLRKRPKIVHFFLPGSYLIAGPLSILCRIPIRIMSRRSMNNYQQKFRFSGWMESQLHRYMHAILGNSKRVFDQLIEEGCRIDKTHLLYNGVHLTTEENPIDTGTLNLENKPIILAMVANLIPYKGHDDLLEALSYLKQVADWKLLLIGNDSAGIEDDLQARAIELGIDDRVSFLGGRDDIPALLARADIGLLTSHEEGFSNAILEGMAAGLPMIVTDVGGNSEAVIDQETGLVVPPHAPESLAHAIERLLRDEAFRLRMGKAGKERAVAVFSMEDCISKYEKLYDQLLQKLL